MKTLCFKRKSPINLKFFQTITNKNKKKPIQNNKYHERLHIPPKHSATRGSIVSSRKYSLFAATVWHRSRRSSTIHFGDQSIRQVSCYTLFNGFWLLWPPSCCLYRSTLFQESQGRRVRHLSQTFGSSHSASSVYQKWPSWHSHSIVVFFSHEGGGRKWTRVGTAPLFRGVNLLQSFRVWE